MSQLRPILEEDAESLFRLVFRTSVTDMLMWDGPASLEEYRAGLKSREELTKARQELIYTMWNEAGMAVGSIGLVPDGANRSASLGLWIGIAHQGMGYGSDAVRQMVELGFDEMKLERLEARIYVGNAASRRVFEKNGFQSEGTLRMAAMKRGVFLDEWVMGAVRGEYRRVNREVGREDGLVVTAREVIPTG